MKNKNDDVYNRLIEHLCASFGPEDNPEEDDKEIEAENAAQEIEPAYCPDEEKKKAKSFLDEFAQSLEAEIKSHCPACQTELPYRVYSSAHRCWFSTCPKCMKEVQMQRKSQGDKNE